MQKKHLSAAISALNANKPCLLLDDAIDAPQGYLVEPASFASEASIARLVNLGKSVICVALPAQRVEELGLPSISANATQSASFDFTVSVEARHGVTTGISASDRAQTLRAIAQSKNPRLDLVSPGHIFPIKAKDGGVLVRSAPAEAALDLLKLAGLEPAATICHLLDVKGQLLGEEKLLALAKSENLPLIRISEIIHKRLSSETILERIAEASLPTNIAGDFKAICFRSKIDRAEHLALIKGDLAEKEATGLQKPILTRVQAENKIGDLLGIGKISSRKRIEDCLELIRKEGRGIFVYIRHPRNDMLKRQIEKRTAPNTSSRASQFREFGVGAQILSNLGAKRLKLLSNVEPEIAGISAFDLEIVERLELV